MFKSILKTVYHPPCLAFLYKRDNCLQKLYEGEKKRLILMKAGPGFGKTSLLALFYQKLSHAKLWLSVPEFGFTYRKLALHIFYGLYAKLSEVEQAKWDGVMHRIFIGSLDTSQISTSLVNLMGEISGELYIFIDECQFLTLNRFESDIEGLHTLLHFAPENVHFVISSRKELPIPVTKFRLNQQFLEIGEEDLIFQREELKAFLEQIGTNADENYLTWLYQKTEGWIAGVSLILCSVVGDEYRKLSEETNLFLQDYLKEIFSGIPAKIKQFLQETCIFETIPVDICNEYLDNFDSQRILDELVESRFLTHRLEQNGVYFYRYHNLLKEFFTQLLDQETKITYHLRLAEVYHRRGQIEAEMAHLIASDQHERAVELIKKEATRILASSDVNLLGEWLDYLESKEVTHDPLLDLYRGRVREARGLLNEAQVYYLRAEPGLLALGDLANWIRVRIQIAGIYWWKESHREAIHFCEDTLPHVPAEEKLSQAGLYNLMGQSSIALKEQTKGIEYLLKARDLSHQSNDINAESWILNNLAFSGYLSQGRMDEAIQTYEQALLNFRKLNNKQGTGLVLANLGYIHLLLSDFKKAEPLFKEAEDICLEMGNTRSIRPVWILQSRLEIIRGNLNKAEELLQKVTESLDSGAPNHHHGQYAVCNSMFYFRKGEMDKAEEWMEKARPYIESCGISQFIQEYYLQWITFYLQTKRYHEAITVAEKILDEVSKEGHNLAQMEASLLLGIAQKESLGKVSNELARVIARIEKGFPFLKKKYATFILDIQGELPDDEIETRIEVFEKDHLIRARFFGEFLIYNRGMKITPMDWTNRKALDLLKYLILHHDRWVRQEELLETFWPDSDVEKGKQTLYVALYTIRRKWEPDLHKSKESRFIQTKRGMYRIQFPAPFWMDTEVFTDYMTEGMRFYKERSFIKAVEFLKEAKRIYCGDFLTENIYDEWTQAHRENYLQNYLLIIITLASIEGEQGNFASAVELLYQVLLKSPFHDQVHTMLMNFLSQSGRNNEAIQHYLKYRKMYKDELGFEMPEEVQKIYQKILK